MSARSFLVNVFRAFVQQKNKISLQLMRSERLAWLTSWGRAYVSAGYVFFYGNSGSFYSNPVI